PPEAPVVPIESLAPEAEPAPGPSTTPVDPYAHLPIVPIESLAPDEEPVPAAAAAPPAAPVPTVAAMPLPSAVELPGADDGWDIAASFLSYEALVAGRSVRAVAASAPAPAPPAPAPAPADAVVDIDDLLYHGRAALERAEELRRELRALNARATSLTTLQPLVDELLDLVELAIAD
ncbi:MAG TPA: hypothetical protein PKA50_04055, partial [Gemmatimonadales bacterium]|nr:hypothetical protein [Gemmatimonadales bacterium]